jgi:hypothetical protein
MRYHKGGFEPGLEAFLGSFRGVLVIRPQRGPHKADSRALQLLNDHLLIRSTLKF